MGKSTRFLPVLVVMLFGLLYTSNALAESDNVVSIDVPITNDALLLDATSYAQDNNVSVEEARQRLMLQKPFGILNEQLLHNEADTFAGVWIQHSPDYRLVVRFTDELQNGISPYLSNELAPYITVDYTAVYSLQEMKSVQEEMIASLNETGLRFETGIKVRTNRVELYVEDNDDFRSNLSRHSIELHPNIFIKQVEDFSRKEVDIFAGLTLVPCTSGFSVRHTDGTLGILTAAHCTDPANDPITFMGTQLPFKGWAYGGSYDFQWRTAPGFTVRDLMFDGTNNRFVRDFKGRDQQMENEYVCKHGKTTGFTCGFIDHKDFRPSEPPGNASATFIYVRNDGGNLSSGGDSGGPWFSGNTAYGLHTDGIGDDAAYMAIDYISFLDLELYIPVPTAVEVSIVTTTDSKDISQTLVISIAVLSFLVAITFASSQKGKIGTLMLLLATPIVIVACSSGTEEKSVTDSTTTTEPQLVEQDSLETPESTPTPQSVSVTDNGMNLHFPQIPASSEGESSKEAELIGELILRSNCLYIRKSNDVEYLPLWPSTFRLSEENDEVTVQNESGEILAKVGDTVFVSGGAVQRDLILDEAVLSILPDECSESYWIVGEEVQQIEQ